MVIPDCSVITWQGILLGAGLVIFVAGGMIFWLFNR